MATCCGEIGALVMSGALTAKQSNGEIDDERKKEDTYSPPSSDANVEAPPPPQPAPAGPTPPPNGGLTAWVQVAGSFLLYFNTWGILNAFGAYQTYYESGKLFHAPSSDISWIGSIEAFLLLITGVFAGPIYDRGYLRLLLITGAFLVVFGHMMLSLCQAYWEVILAQGIVIGVGTGLLFVPCVAINAQYFSTRLGLAVGVAATGSSLGGVIYPIVLYRLINEIGFAWAVRVEGFLALATLLIPIALLKLRVQPPKVRALIDWSAFVDVQFMSFVFSGIIAYMGLFVFFFYVAYYSQDQHFLGTAMSFYLVPIFNAASCFGRSLPNALADKTGSFNMLAPGTFLAGVFMLCMMAISSGAGIIILAIFTGFISGVMIGMPPLCFVALTPDKSRLGTRMGMGFAMLGFGILAGGPGGGAILRDTPPLDWTGLWTFGGVTACVAGLGVWGVRVLKFGWKVNKKA